MSRWSIYNRNGEKLYESKEGLTSTAKGNAVEQDTLEYTGKRMGDRFVTISFKSPYPIDFKIGDYLEYRGERFTLNYEPPMQKKSSIGTYGEAFVYDNLKFSSYLSELTDAKFHDWVLSDNKIHYSSLPNFSFYAIDVNDLCDRLQACTDRWCKDNGYATEDYWIFYTPSSNGDKNPWDRTVTRCKDVSTDDTFINKVIARWKEIYGDTGTNTYREDELTDKNISVSNNTVWQGLAMVKSQFGLNFINRNREIIVGMAGLPTSHVFKYGKGNGLYEVDRNADSDQKVVTRLHAYGSSDNLPVRYYAEIGAEVYATIKSVEDNSKDNHYADFTLDLAYVSRYFNTPLTQYGDNIFAVGIKIGDVVVNARINGADSNGNIRIYIECLDNAKDADDNTDYTNFGKFQDAIAVGAKVFFTKNVEKSAFPVANLGYEDGKKVLPDNMAIDTLMLPGFPKKALCELCKSEYDKATDTTTYKITNPDTGTEVDFHSEPGNHLITFSADAHDPYIVSPNADTLGYKDDDIFCNEENDDNGLKKVYPSVEDVTEAEAGTSGEKNKYVNEVVGADVIDDNGVFPENTKIKGFKIRIKNLGFDLYQSIRDAGGESCQISMKSGYCAGRTFDVASVEKDTASDNTGGWILHCKRVKDTSEKLWYPFSYNKSIGQTPVADETYQVKAGDRFVLLGISMNDTNYVWAASVKLLRKAIHWLCKNDYTRYVYNPKVDEIYMARQDEEAQASNGKIASLHDTLREGDVLLFKDDDLLIDGSVYIDQLVIKENGNNGIPTYDVTLKNEVTVGTIDRIQNTVDSIRNDINSGAVGGTSPSQVKNLIEAYGVNWFLRKDTDDTASGLITFLKGLAVGGAKKYGIDPEGVATLLKVIADSGVIDSLTNTTLTNTTLTSEDASIRNLTVTGAAHFFRLIIDEIKASGGSVLVTPANGFKVAKVVKEPHGDDYRLYFRADDGERAVTNKWKVGMQAVSMSFNAAKGESMDAENHYWWALVTAVSAGAVSPEWDTAHRYHWVEVSSTDTAYGSTVPQTGDEVAQLGYRIQGDDDPELRTYTDGDGTTHQYCPLQSAIYLSAYDSLDSGLVAPFLAFYRGISDFDLKSHRKTYFDARANMLVGDVYNISGMIEDVILSKPVIGYEIRFMVNGVAVGVLNYDTIKDASTATLECDFLLNGEAYTSKSCRLGCYDSEGQLMGSEITSTDTSSAVVDGGSLYLSKDCKYIQCAFSIDGGGEHVESLTVVTDGESVKVTKTEYKYAISPSPNASIDWSKITAQATPPQPSVAQGSYLYVMTIVTYSDGSTTNAISISYCGTNGTSVQVTGTSVTYAVTDKSTQPADSAFTSTSVPAVAVGQYLWSKTVVNYSDGKSTKSYAVSRVGNDGDTGYSLHFAYADNVTYSGSTPTVTNFSTTRTDSSKWLGVNSSKDVNDPTDPAVYQWTLIKGDKGDKGDAACFIRVFSSAGTVYKNHKVSTVLTARVFRGSEDVTDRCTGTFSWYKTENGVGLGLKSDGRNVFSVTGSESSDEVKYMCIYDGDISEKAYGLTYGGKSVTFGGKDVVRYGE